MATDLRDAARAALEANELLRMYWSTYIVALNNDVRDRDRGGLRIDIGSAVQATRRADEALRAALAQPEPVEGDWVLVPKHAKPRQKSIGSDILNAWAPGVPGAYDIAHELYDRMVAAAPPPPGPPEQAPSPPTREAIARVIDGFAFRSWEAAEAYLIKQGDGDEYRADFRRTFHANVDIALTKADAVIAYLAEKATASASITKEEAR